VIALVALLSLVPAETRIAIVAGHNTGAEGRTPLRYAEADAARVRRALIEAGAVPAADIKLLQAPTVAQLDEARRCCTSISRRMGTTERDSSWASRCSTGTTSRRRFAARAPR
jgi:hypothetical protein